MTIDLGVPLIAAPMAGGVSTPELVAAVNSAGGMGFLAAGYLAPSGLQEQIARTRELSSGAFGVNVFVPDPRSGADLSAYRERVAAAARQYGLRPGAATWDEDDYLEKLRVLSAEQVPVVSFTFGCPNRNVVDSLRERGSAVIVTVTTPAEARQAAEVGADALCVQGAEAGGHRAVFTDDGVSAGGGPLYGLLAALRLIGAEVDLPLIGAGGLAHGADLAAVLSAGAVAGQCGTAFLRCPEAGTSAVQRDAMAQGGRETAVTRAFSGRPARGMVNRFLTENGPHAPAAYPQVHHLTKPVRAAAANAGDPESTSLWAGQTYSLATSAPAAEVVQRFGEELRTAVASLTRRLGY